MNDPSCRRRCGIATRTLLAAMLLIAPTAAGASQATSEELRQLTRRYQALTNEGGPTDPASLAAEFVLLLQDLKSVERGTLPLAERIDHDVLNWLLDVGIIEYVEPELSKYEVALIRHTGARQDPERLHQLGLDEVARIRAAMEALVQRYDSSAKLEEFLDAAREDSRLYAGSRDELVELARRAAATIRRNLGTLFDEVPTTPFQIVTPGERRSPGYMGWYQGPGRGPEARGFVVLNPDPRQVPLFVLDALIVHEAIPGHHFQMAWAAESVDVPEWRRDILLTVFVEGWGLYAESLGAELGVYRHPMSEFGRLNLEMWRAIRLVVDTGLHAFDWTPQQATEFFLENTALPRAQVRVEVDRYARNPGQAVAYKIGEQHLLAIRARAEGALGVAFDVRGFHRAVLEHGPMPMRTLEEVIDIWVAEQQTAPDP
ncbi:MAG: DUF885 family protein [Acidobacteria bacterium]|nr:DUF885 family protein [Acidobacteriota bacterium]